MRQVSGVLVAAEGDVAERTSTRLGDAIDATVTAVSSIGELEAELGTRDDVACVVATESIDGGSADGVLAAVQDRPLPPAVVCYVREPAPLTAAEAIEAGADGFVRRNDGPDDPERRLIARVENVLERPPGPTTVRDEMRAAIGTVFDDGIALVDDDRKHVLAAGDDLPAAPERLEGRSASDAIGGAAGTYLDADYAAALDGDRRERDLTVDDERYRISVDPAGDEDAPVVVRFRRRPTGTTTDADTSEKVERLHDIASELDAADSEAEIYDLAVDTADRVLEFDGCVIAEATDGRIAPRAATASELRTEPAAIDDGEGIAGRTVRDGEPLLVDDVREHPDAEPSEDRFRAALSIPVGDDLVFQAASTERGYYTETDLDLAELLMTHVEHALERVRYERTLTTERDRLAALFENVPDAAIQYRIDDGLRIERVNSAFVRLFGFDPERVVGESVDSVLVPAEARESAERLHETVVEGEQVEREVRRHTTDGTEPFLVRNVPITSQEADRQGYLIYTDIGELKERERQLERKNERLDAFARVVSHDLRNPLTVAQGYLEDAREGDTGTAIDEIEASLNRMERMIDELLALARQGETIADTEPVRLDDVARAAWDHVDTGRATLTIEDGRVLLADRDRLVQLLENCFRNAVEHGSDEPSVADAPEHGTSDSATDPDVPTPSGGENGSLADGASLQVQVGPLEGGFFVADEGPGIPDDRKDEVFEMGYSTAKDGTGFGLAIVDEIADAHGWSVDVTDGRSGGARFEFTDVTDPDGGM